MLGLLLLLLLLGFAFFSFATQEQASAEYYADAGKIYDVEIDSDALFDWALDQLIIGPQESNTQSVLWPGRHSLVPNMLGMFAANAQGVPYAIDRQPFNGTGVNIISGPNGQVIVDTDYDGDNATNDNPEYTWINFSGAARAPLGIFYNRTQLSTLYPSIDAGYTYPDINNVFLAHVESINGTRVVIPSMHRPQYLRDNSGAPLGNWAIDNFGGATDTRTRVLCPHPGHVNVADGVTPRYFDPTVYPGGFVVPLSVPPRTIQPFVFLHDTDGLGTYSEAGVWTNSPVNNNDYPCDNDNDSIREGVWVDLNFPPQTLPDGRTYVPLFSYTVLDADGLVNVNLHGNLAGFVNLAHPLRGKADPFGGPQVESISRSNLGVSATEVNPWWALMADPNDTAFLNPINSSAPHNALQQYRGFFGLNNLDAGPSSTDYVISRSEAANMDLLFMLQGRPKYDVSINGMGQEVFTINDLVQGRWGEAAQLLQGAQTGNIALFPRPGRLNIDDDNDQYAGVNDALYEPYFTGLPMLPSVGKAMLPDGHPFDNLGSGVSLLTANYGFGNVRAARLLADPFNPLSTVRYRQYAGYSSGSQYQLFNPTFGAQVNQATAGLLLDEGDEVVVDRRYVQTYGQNDNVFLPDEMSGLHLSQADYTATLGSSRLRQLMPFNFELNLQAASIRKRFTTDSWDRREHGFAFCNYPAGATARGNWEFNADVDGDGNKEFPPVSNLSVATPGLPNVSEPYRLEVRAVIGSELFNNTGFGTSLFNQQLRLNINRLLTLQNPFTPMNQASNVPVYRQLTPHPEVLASTPIPGTVGGPAIPTTFNPSAGTQFQEYWARIDRQKMARDIYVMLYTLGGGNDATDYATTANTITAADPSDPTGTLQQRTLYSDRQLREMAQFAVNVVDSLDRDEVLTRFEYDRNLADGWNLDDNPYTFIGGNETGTIPPNDRGEVWGVEMQSLTISEILAVRQPASVGVPSNNSHTPWDDTVPFSRCFTFAELRNVAPWSVDLSTGGWRLRMVRPVVSALGTNRSVVPLYNGLTGTQSIPADGTFTIGNMGREDKATDTFTDGTGATVTRAADFRVDLAGDGQFELVAPAPQIPEPAPPTGTEDRPPATNLDLVHARDYMPGNRFLLIDHGPAPLTTPLGGSQTTNTDVTLLPTERGGWYRSENAAEDIYFILERRAHLTRAAPSLADNNQLNDNPWIEVDRFQTFGVGGTLPTLQAFPLQPGDATAQITTYLTNITSSERSHVLNRAFLPNNFGGTLNNTLGQQRNSRETAANPLVWQPHFDRDFASVVDLLSVPLYGPDTLTARLAVNGTLAIDGMNGEMVAPVYEARIAQAKFLRPSHPTTATLDNRWYRILELLEFPSRANHPIETSGVPQNAVSTLLKRVPAKINLNGLRHPEVLFALLDDPNVFNLSLQDTLDAGRLWWNELINARDGRDPGVTVVSQPLPGSVGSRPFRDLSFAAGMPAAGTSQGTPALERTLLRRLTLDNSDLNNNGTQDPGEGPATGSITYNPPASAPRQLFEARPQTDLNQNNVDYHTRNRLLAKIANNSTSRGNVFIVYISVGFFDSYQPDPVNNPGIVQIGAEMTDQPRRRGFFIIDRTLLEEGIDPSNPSSMTFDFRRFVQYRKTIQ